MWLGSECATSRSLLIGRLQISVGISAAAQAWHIYEEIGGHHAADGRRKPGEPSAPDRVTGTENRC
jgi:hypothetical protein